MCWVCVYNPRTGPIPRLVTQHAAVQDQEAHTTQHTHYTHIWTAVIHTLHTHTLSHSTPVMDRLMHSSLFLGRTRHGKNSDTMTRATRAFAYTRSIATGASPHTIHITRKYEWPTVGRTHTIVRLQTIIRRKDGTENFGGFVHVLDGFLQRDFVLWVFVCSVSFSLSFPATTPRATTPHQYAQGYHALTTTARLSRLCIYPGYHAIV